MKQALRDIQGAIADYEKAVELDPEDAITLNNLGLLEEQVGRMQSAKERFAAPMRWTASWTNRPFPRNPRRCQTRASPAPPAPPANSPWAEVTRAVHAGRAKRIP